MPTEAGGWRSHSPMGGEGFPLPGLPPQAIPVGSTPPSAGDPDLLPRLTEHRGIDISTPVLNGSTLAFTITPMTLGPHQTRQKRLDWLTWTNDPTLTTTCGQYLAVVTTIPVGLAPVDALVQRSFFIYDVGTNASDVPFIRGEWFAPLYVPALRDVVIYITNDTPASDPGLGASQRMYAQWSLI